jgi:Ion channel
MADDPTDGGQATRESGATTPPGPSGAAPPRPAWLDVRRTAGITDRYGLVLLLLIATIFLSATAGDTRWGPPVVLVILAATVYAALRASDVQRRLLRVAVALIPAITIAGVAVSLLGDTDLARGIAAVFTAMLVVVAPPAIARRFWKHPVIDVRTFYAAVCVYLLIAMFFATMYSLSARLSGQPFFVQSTDPSSFDYLYFSFVTMSTTGYGDFTAAGGAGKSLAILEMLVGQLYLVTVVALVVNNLAQGRQAKIGREDRARTTTAEERRETSASDEAR